MRLCLLCRQARGNAASNRRRNGGSAASSHLLRPLPPAALRARTCSRGGHRGGGRREAAGGSGGGGGGRTGRAALRQRRPRRQRPRRGAAAPSRGRSGNGPPGIGAASASVTAVPVRWELCFSPCFVWGCCFWCFFSRFPHAAEACSASLQWGVLGVPPKSSSHGRWVLRALPRERNPHGSPAGTENCSERGRRDSPRYVIFALEKKTKPNYLKRRESESKNQETVGSDHTGQP